MPFPIALCKFTGTISLGLLTGVSYTVSTQSLPTLLTLPSATPAAYTLGHTTRLAGQHTRVLSAVSATSLLLAFVLSPPRTRHPYLLWTGVVAAASGAMGWAMERSARDEGEMNGEQVERRARDWQWLEFVRTGVAGVGFAMGVVGIWGDGA